MQVWEAINILESLDPKAEVTLVIGKAAKPKEDFHIGKLWDKTHVIGKEQWPQKPPCYPAWHHNVTCSSTKH